MYLGVLRPEYLGCVCRHCLMMRQKPVIMKIGDEYLRLCRCERHVPDLPIGAFP